MQPKDYVTLSIALIGVALSLFNTIWNLLLRRTLIIEPYFKNSGRRFIQTCQTK